MKTSNNINVWNINTVIDVDFSDFENIGFFNIRRIYDENTVHFYIGEKIVKKLTTKETLEYLNYVRESKSLKGKYFNLRYKLCKDYFPEIYDKYVSKLSTFGKDNIINLHRIYKLIFGSNFNSRFRNAMLSVTLMMTPPNIRKIFFEDFPNYRSINNELLLRCLKNIKLVETAVYDNIPNITPYVMFYGMSPHDLKIHFGKGLWRRLHKLPIHTNKTIVNMLIGTDNLKKIKVNNFISSLEQSKFTQKQLVTLKKLGESFYNACIEHGVNPINYKTTADNIYNKYLLIDKIVNMSLMINDEIPSEMKKKVSEKKLFSIYDSLIIKKANNHKSKKI